MTIAVSPHGSRLVTCCTHIVTDPLRSARMRHATINDCYNASMRIGARFARRIITSNEQDDSR